jgi:hypothetical protein
VLQNDPACKAVPPASLGQVVKLPAAIDTWPWESLVLIGWLLVFRALIYIALRVKTDTSSARRH